jgi:hypothetical protein
VKKRKKKKIGGYKTRFDLIAPGNKKKNIFQLSALFINNIIKG